jgi:plastocyanin
MRRFLLFFFVAGALAVAAVAAAATATVTITKAGYVPSSTTIAQGDTVQWTNADTVVHQVSIKSTAGVTCTPNPVVLQPTQSGSCTFQTAGNYTYSDPAAKGNTFRGTITVSAAQTAVSLTTAPHSVVFGGHVTLSGADASHRSGENVDVYGQQCGASAATKVTTVQTTTNGAFTASVQPLLNTTYSVKVHNATSPSTNVTVRPRVHLSKVAPHRYSVRVSAASSFAGKVATFQRYNGTRWLAVKSLALRANSTGVAPTVITSGSFRSSLRSGVRVRVMLSQAQVGSCYLAGISNAIRS